MTIDEQAYSQGVEAESSCTAFNGTVPLCLAKNANVGHLAYDSAAPLIPMRPAAQLNHVAVAPVANDQRETPHTVLSSGEPQNPPTLPAFHGAVLSTAPTPIHSLGAADLAGAKLGLAVAELAERALSRAQDVIDQSGMLIAPQCNVTFAIDGTGFVGNSGVMVVFEWTGKDPSGGERKFITSALMGGSIASPLVGGASYRYSASTDDSRQGHNYSFQTTVKTSRDHAYGFGVGDSVVQGPTVNAWKHNAAGANFGPELLRIDFMERIEDLLPQRLAAKVAVRAVPAFRALQATAVGRAIEDNFRPGLKCGGAFMIRGPVLRYVPGYPWISRIVRGIVSMKDRVINNRSQYQHEDDVSSILKTMFLHQGNSQEPFAKSH